MCTLSFVPRRAGYGVGMNRDEMRLRPPALFPRIYERDQMLAAYPSEPEGGTWIAVNGSGVLLALLNWNLHSPGTGVSKQRSRGELIPELIFQDGLESAEIVLEPRRLAGVLPFRLVGVDPQRRSIREWRWDGGTVTTLRFPWMRRHWFSSSLSDSTAERQRGATCRIASATGNPGNFDWLAELHRSHRPTAGAYSLCVHRPDAATVSYTEAIFDTHYISMRYIDGSPCESAGFHHVLEMPRSFGAVCYPRSAAAAV
jgi:hypothetical protein